MDELFTRFQTSLQPGRGNEGTVSASSITSYNIYYVNLLFSEMAKAYSEPLSRHSPYVLMYPCAVSMKPSFSKNLLLARFES